MSKLDDLKLIHDRDKSDALGVAEKQWQQLSHNFSLENTEVQVENIVYAGMGGSSLSALLSQTWPGYNKPFEVVRDYSLPAYVNDKTLVIVASFSGNTEETLSCLSDAENRGANICVIASGGELARLATEKGYKFAHLPTITQPRYGALYVLKAVVEILVSYGLLEQSKREELERTADWLKDKLSAWRADVPTSDNSAKQLALELMGSSPVIYASSLFASVAYKWKISINENAKNVAWWGVYPEFNHNEFLGWTSHPIDKPYRIVDLRSNLDHPQITKRFEISDQMLSGKRPAAEVVNLEGSSVLEQMLYGVAFGDFVSLYLAILNGIDPTPVEIISKLKANLV